MSVDLRALGTGTRLVERFLAAYADSSFSLCRNIAAGPVDAITACGRALEDADLAHVPVIR